MDDRRNRGQANLTGVWDGRYAYPLLFKPVSFTAVILDVGSSFSGTIHEQPEKGPGAGMVLIATIDGGRSGNAVHFTKVYDPVKGGRFRKAVKYDGGLNGDATEIDGRWSIPGNWSGTFMMIRSSPPAAAEEVRTWRAPTRPTAIQNARGEPMPRLKLRVAIAFAAAALGLSLCVIQAAAADASQCDPNARVQCRTQASQKKTACIRAGSAGEVCDAAYTQQLNACMKAARCPVYSNPLRPH